MAESPAHLARAHRLHDGRTVTIRPIRPDDAALTLEFLSQLSGESRYLRFQKWIGAPSGKLTRFMTETDYDRQMAFVCAAPRDGGEEIVGDARYVVNPDGESCEFGIMVADAWHNTGIAGLLMETLFHSARSHGLKRMEGLVLATNTIMLHFARGLGFEASSVPEDRTTMRVVKAL